MTTPPEQELRALRQREVQMIGAALSTRDWSALESGYNQLRDKIDRMLIKPVPESRCTCWGSDPWCDFCRKDEVTAQTPPAESMEAARFVADDAAVAAAARKALGEWLAWPDAGRDGPVAVDNEKTISWLQGVPARFAQQSAKPEVWRPIETPPTEDCGVLLWVPGERHDRVSIGQDYSVQVGFYSHGAFREQGTGHDLRERLESWGGDGVTYPTHWKPLPDAPSSSLVEEEDSRG